MKFITLGTGAAVPTLKRGHAAGLLWWNGRYFLFDCGEGTQIQFRRAGLKFAPLEGIFISHLHGDHILGIMGLLMSLELSERKAPLSVYAPPGIKEYMDVSKRLMNTNFNFDININEIKEDIIFRGSGYTITSFFLEHRITSVGYSFIEDDMPGKFNVEEARNLGIPEGPLYGRLHRGEDIVLSDGRLIKSSSLVGPKKSGRNVVYCGDTRPCRRVIEMAEDADLLIYEGTFSPDSLDKAKVSCHSTTEEAAEIAKKANVRKLVITHISSRYQDEENLMGKSREIFPEIILAKDFMEIEIPFRAVEMR